MQSKDIFKERKSKKQQVKVPIETCFGFVCEISGEKLFRSQNRAFLA